MLGSITYSHCRAARDSYTAVHQDLPTLFTRFLHPLTDRCELVLEAVDTVVTDALDVQHFYAAFALLHP